MVPCRSCIFVKREEQRRGAVTRGLLFMGRVDPLTTLQTMV